MTLEDVVWIQSCFVHMNSIVGLKVNVVRGFGLNVDGREVKSILRTLLCLCNLCKKLIRLNMLHLLS